MPFDPDGPSLPGSGVFGLPIGRDGAGIVLIPAPFDATTSYRHGCAHGPEAIRSASQQVELLDPHFGQIWECGIHMEPASDEIAQLHSDAARLARPIIEKGGAGGADRQAVRKIDEQCAGVHRNVRDEALRAFEQEKIVGVVGGEHSVAYGGISAAATRFESISVLQIDAHMDLREAYEGLAWSHASVMFNVLRDLAGVERLVQIGIRDRGRSEIELARRAGGRIVAHEDAEWSARIDSGESFASLAQRGIEDLSDRVWVSFDIDGLDPSLCPSTGTPVPGGLSFTQASMLLQALRESGRRIVGFDLSEVCPSSREHDDWDAIVGARILYKLCGCAAPL